jgi:hypothetical protein
VHHRPFDILLGDPARRWRHGGMPPDKEQGEKAADKEPKDAIVALD